MDTAMELHIADRPSPSLRQYIMGTPIMDPITAAMAITMADTTTAATVTMGTATPTADTDTSC